LNMIKSVKGNILEAKTEAVVNTVNCVGIMGKGIALQFKQAYPGNYAAYKKNCDQGQMRIGRVYVYSTGSMVNPKFIINFPTKRHWKAKSTIDDIKLGLGDLIRKIVELDITSIAVPPLGCGNGGLDWEVVKPIIEKAFANLSNVEVALYVPYGAPTADLMPVRTLKPNWTRLRALLIKLFESYKGPGYKLSMLEIQKLAYFLGVSGEKTDLKFVKQQYGPYSEQLNFVLQRIEGHFIRGYGDRTKEAQIHLQPNAVKEADRFLMNETEAAAKLDKISRLIDGFETPYGMELLATVHWVCIENPLLSNAPDEVVSLVHSWNARKMKLFSKEHINIAWRRLSEQGYLN
jgi:O-acetyl-ADP-ribose deacetylase (regulator of RNase III)